METGIESGMDGGKIEEMDGKKMFDLDEFLFDRTLAHLAL